MVKKNKETIQKMFDDISSSYDLLNHINSAGSDIVWRKKVIKEIKTNKWKSENILDIASGTGDFSNEFSKLSPNLLISLDLSYGMLSINKKKNIHNNFQIQAECDFLPFDNKQFDIVGIAFGVRNFENIERSLIEIKRVLKPHGKLIVMEMFSYRKNKLSNKLFNYYFSKIIPIIGNKVSKSKNAYNYLFDSVNDFLTILDFNDLLVKLNYKSLFTKKNFLDIVYTSYSENS
jgi:demethylmenaquinone methyltransferase / 2-methoxy-6-polyprenyl-1,4-benzoquinol methylase